MTARVQPARPRIRHHESTTESMATGECDARSEVIEARTATRRPTPRLEGVRVTLLESTFYLLDPEGWR